MKSINQKIIWCGFIILIGVTLILVSVIMGRADSVTTGFAVGLSAAGLAKAIQYMRLKKNPEMVQRFEVQQNDERYISLSEKSGRLAFLLSLFAEIIVGVIFAFMGKEDIARAACMLAGLQTVFYFVIYWILMKKY